MTRPQRGDLRGDVAVLGVPFDENSSFRRGAALGPAALRECLYSASTNLCTEDGRDLSSISGWNDVGDVSFSADRDPVREIEASISDLLSRQKS